MCERTVRETSTSDTLGMRGNSKVLGSVEEAVGISLDLQVTTSRKGIGLKRGIDATVGNNS
jgi:hypothetical protein